MPAWTALLLTGAAATLSAQPGGAPEFDDAAVERGKAAFITACSFGHGSNARGGESGPDWVHSALVIDDENGRQLSDFLKAGRPGAGEIRLFENAVLEEGRRQVLVVDRNGHPKFGARSMQQPCVTSFVVVDVETSALQRRDDLFRLQCR